MTSFLVEMSKAGLDLQLQGDDSRLKRYEAASAAIAERLADDPAAYVGAVLAGLDPDTPADDAAIELAQEALVESWPSVESIFTDAPRGIYRALLLDACGAAEGDDAAAIVWLTAADTFPMCRLGRQKAPVEGLLMRLAERVETQAAGVPAGPTLRSLISKQAAGVPAAPALPNADVTVGAVAASSEALAPSKVDRDALARRVQAAVGPNYKNQQPPLVNANPHWANQADHWAWAFADRMTPLLADQLDEVLKKNAELGDTLHASLTNSQAALATKVTQALSAQQDWVQKAITSAKAQQDAERLRVSALWWSEALYSPRLRRSYRALPPALAAVVMALDLHDLTPSLPPASVGYLLAETVGRLPEASFEQTRPLVEWLGVLRGATGVDLGKIGAALCAPPTHGRVSVRDVLAATLRGASPDPALLNRLPGGPDTPMSLPDLAHALFRQEKGLLLAGGEP